jgi:hypothetical protein
LWTTAPANDFLKSIRGTEDFCVCPRQAMVARISAKIRLAIDKMPGGASAYLTSIPSDLLRPQRLRKTNQILGLYLNGTAAWAINVRYQEERYGHRDR